MFLIRFEILQNTLLQTKYTLSYSSHIIVRLIIIFEYYQLLLYFCFPYDWTFVIYFICLFASIIVVPAACIISLLVLGFLRSASAHSNNNNIYCKELICFYSEQYHNNISLRTVNVLCSRCLE